MIMYRGHDRILQKAVALGVAPGTLSLGVAGPTHLDYDHRPNWQNDSWSLSPRDQLSDFIADEWSNDGGASDAQMKAFLARTARRAASAVSVSRDQYGAVLETVAADGQVYPWDSESLADPAILAWQPYGDWKPSDWDSVNPGKEFVQPWRYADCAPLEALQGYPYCEPLVFHGYFEPYENCLSPPCAAQPVQNPRGLTCGSCAALGLWGMSGFPLGAVYVTATGPHYAAEEILGASLINGHTCVRVGGLFNIRYRMRFAPGTCSGDYLYWLAKLLFEAGSSPWQAQTKYVAIATAAERIAVKNTILLSEVSLAFPEMLDAAWTIQSYVAPVWTPPNAPPNPPDVPEVLPRAELTITGGWTNGTEEAVTVRTIGIAGYNAAESRWELLFWGPLDSPVTVEPEAVWQPDSVVLRISDLEGN